MADPLDLDAEEAVHRKCLAGTACYHSARGEHTRALVVLAELRADHAATARVVAAARALVAARDAEDAWWTRWGHTAPNRESEALRDARVAADAELRAALAALDARDGAR